MKIGFIGAGKVGFTLGKYFKEHGIDVTGYYSRNLKSAKEAARFTETIFYESIEQVLTVSDALFLTVPDNVISVVWDTLKTMPIQDKIICHCSGSLSSGIFDGIENYQACGYSIHPFLAINSRYTSYTEICQAFFTLEGSEKHLSDMNRIIERLGNLVYIIEENQKTQYHAAAVFLSNHVIALADTGSKLLKKCGFSDDFIEIALKTLFINNCMKIAECGVLESLTGPVERNDIATVENHIACLDEKEQKIYKLLSLQLIEIAKEKHKNVYLKMKELLI
jgi:predicted short-subunit dehydrogenase-like oxidoreductase (DUF2520 family)